MNITVYCGSNPGRDPEYVRAAEELGNYIGRNGHDLIYGGSGKGLMGIVAGNVKKHGSKVIGVYAMALKGREHLSDELDELISLNTISDRRWKMIELGDIYIALPGGPGTLEELSEVISHARINDIKGKCVIFNVNGYYDPLKTLIGQMADNEFITDDEYKRIHFIDSIKELDELINSK